MNTYHDRRVSLGIAVLFLGAAMGSTSTASTAIGASESPNVVLIFADDLGYGDLGCYGATKVKTPNIDRLAREGRRFTDAHSASAVCTPSRYGLLTGEYPVRKGIWGPCSHSQPLLIDTNKLTLGKLFKNKSYSTAAVGKWHLGFGSGRTDWNKPLRPGPLELGFDYYFGVPKVNSGFPYVYVENDRIVGWDENDPLVFGKQPYSQTPTFSQAAGRKTPNRFSGAAKAHAIYHDERTASLLVDKSVKWIEDNKQDPFFLYLPTTNIHHPFTPAPQFKGASECGLYGDFIQELDWMVGEVLQCLDDQGVAENTLVIFTSDNGGMFNTGGQDAFKDGHRQNGDLLGFKFGIWEGGHRVPFIARWPGNIKPNTTSKQLISSVDMLASFAALTQQSVPKQQLADSVNVLPALTGEPASPLRDHVVLSPHKASHLSIRKGKWMYIDAKGSGGFNGSKPGEHTFSGPAAATYIGNVNSDLTPDGKIRKDAPPGQLYDLENDVLQTTNLYREHPGVVAEMQELLKTYQPKKTARKRSGPKKQPKVNAANDSPISKAKATPQPAPKAGTSSTQPPNFVVIFTDDQGYGDLSCFGGTHVNTPRIDQMAAEGVKLTSFYVAAPVCTPSRAALMTGCYPKRIEMATGSTFGVLLAGDRKGLHPDEITIAEVLKSAGYQTGMFGKWHLGDQPEFLPTRQGFDQFFGIPYSHDIHPFHPAQQKFGFPPLPLLDGETVVEMDPDANLLTRRITEHAVNFIKSNRDGPFFMYVPHPIPHRPLHASDPFMGDVSEELLAKLKKENGKTADFKTVDYKTRDKLFRQAVSEIDWSVGQILDTLQAEGIDDNTLVIFTSDNGPAVGRATPLKGRKGQTFEGGMREPTVIRWPGTLAAGTVNDHVMTTMDLLPTFARLSGAQVPSDRVIDGKDVWPVLAEQQQSPHDAFFYHSGNKLEAVRSGKWKFRIAGRGAPSLFNLDDDIGEKRNVLESHPDVVKRLLTRLTEFEADVSRNRRPAAYVDNPVPLHK